MKKAKHYVYVYMDPRKELESQHCGFSFKYEVFYVGKGSGDRYCQHLREARNTDHNSHKLNKIRNILDCGMEPIIEILCWYKDEMVAYGVEEELIVSIGKKIDGNGPLTNLADGGLGAKCGELNPFYGKTHTPEALEKIANAAKGRPSPRKGVSMSDDFKQKVSEGMKGIFAGELNPFYGKTHTEETKQKIREKKLGNKVSEETKQKIRETILANNSLKEPKPKPSRRVIDKKTCVNIYTIAKPDGVVVVCDNLAQFCKQEPIFLDSSGFLKMMKQGKAYKGYVGTVISKKEINNGESGD